MDLIMGMTGGSMVYGGELRKEKRRKEKKTRSRKGANGNEA